MESPDFEYIDAFFTGALNAEEAGQFEKRIASDPAFAEEVAFYISALQAIREEQAAERENRFREIYRQTAGAEKTPVRRLWTYIGAAALVAGIVFSLYIFMRPAPVKQLADRYIGQQLQTLGVTMASREDSMQKGLVLYNQGKFPEALQQFEQIIQSDSANFTARKYAGLACLRLRHYDKALQYFRQLENYPGLYANPALFYQALTLMERNQAGDDARAKALLKQVVDQDLEGKQTAQDWLKKW